VLITPISNGNIPACGTAQWATNCRKTFVTTCVGNLESEMPATALEQTHFLGQTYPNPSNGTTMIDYFLPDYLAGSTIDIFDIS
jgi:hypothetical protein